MKLNLTSVIFFLGAISTALPPKDNISGMSEMIIQDIYITSRWWVHGLQHNYS